MSNVDKYLDLLMRCRALPVDCPEERLDAYLDALDELWDKMSPEERKAADRALLGAPRD